MKSPLTKIIFLAATLSLLFVGIFAQDAAYVGGSRTSASAVAGVPFAASQLKTSQTPPSAIKLATARGKLGRKNRESTEKLKFTEVDLSRYVSGRLFAELKVSPGGCDAALVTAATPTEDRRQRLEFTRASSGKSSSAELFGMGSGTVRLLGKNVNKFYVTGSLIPVGMAAWYSKDCSGSYEIIVYITSATARSTPNSTPNRPSAPCNDREIQVDYDRRSPNYHRYGPYETLICSTSNPKCSRRSVFSIMTSQARLVTPAFSTSPVRNCAVLDASPILGVSDHVRSVVDSGDFAVTNYTKKDHRFHPGKVTRRIVEKNGSIYVVTDGEGTGKQKGFNEFISRPTWREVDTRLRGTVRGQL